MANFSFGLTEGSFPLLNDQKNLRSAAEDLKLTNKKELNEINKNGEGTDIIKFSTGHKFI